MFNQISTGYLQCAINLGIDKADQTFPPHEVIAPLLLKLVRVVLLSFADEF